MKMENKPVKSHVIALFWLMPTKILVLVSISEKEGK